MTVNVVVLAGTVAADPVELRMPSGDEIPSKSCGCHDTVDPSFDETLQGLANITRTCLVEWLRRGGA